MKYPSTFVSTYLIFSAVHFGIKRYTCVICSMGFSKKKYLEQHVAAHQNENQPEENRSMRRGRKKYFIPNPNGMYDI